MIKFLKDKIIGLSIAFSNVEKNIFKQNQNDLDEPIDTKTNVQGKLTDYLLRGELTEEVKNLRWRTYKILTNSKYKVLVRDYVDSNGNIFYNIHNIETQKFLNKIKIDSEDNYKLEMVIPKIMVTTSISDTNFDSESSKINKSEYQIINKEECTIEIGRDSLPKFTIENYTKKINIRGITDTKKMIEFYISKYPDKYDSNNGLFLKQISKILNGEDVNKNYLNIKTFDFVSNNTIGVTDLLHFSYNEIKFDKIIEFDGNYVIKYIANVVVDGEDITKDFIQMKLEEKYKIKKKK